MALGTVQGVMDLTGSSDTHLIDRQLVFARGIVDDELADAGLTTPTTSVTLSMAVNYLTASMVGIMPGAVNPRTGFTVDGFARKDGNESQIDEWEKRGTARIARYITGVNAAADTCSIPTMSVVGRGGQRIGTHEEMSDEEAY